MLNLLPQNITWWNCVCGAFKLDWESFQGGYIYLAQRLIYSRVCLFVVCYNVWADGTEGKAVVIRCYWNPEANCVSIFYGAEYSLLPSERSTPYYKPLAIKHSKALIQKENADLFLQTQIWLHLISSWGITLLTIFICSSQD